MEFVLFHILICNTTGKKLMLHISKVEIALGVGVENTVAFRITKL